MDIKKTWLFTRPIAHRGLHSPEIPENSLASFVAAAKAGFPIELDVRMTDEMTVVVFHDEKLSRMTKKDGYLGTTAASDLKNMHLINTLGEVTDQTIPTFEQVLEAVNGAVPILIETKDQTTCGPMESRVIDILRSYKGEIAVQSFSPFSLKYFKDHAFEIPRGQLSTRFTKQELPAFFKRSFLRKLRMNYISQPDFISYNFEELPNKWVSRTKLPVLTWTIRSNADLERIKPFCDNIIFENFIPDTEK